MLFMAYYVDKVAQCGQVALMTVIKYDHGETMQYDIANTSLL